MKKLLFLALLMAAVWPSFPAGLIVIEDPSHWPEIDIRPAPQHRIIPPPRRWAPLEVTRVEGNVRIDDQIAKTSIEQEFYNPNSRRLEGTFLLPVPSGAHLDRFAMEVDGKRVEAELLSAEKAREIYENIVRQAKDPALLEYAGRDLFKVRIFPIEPHSTRRVSLSWTQVLKSDAGVVRYVFPMNTERFSARPVKNLSLKVEIQSRRSLKAIYSPSHQVEVKRPGDHKATIGYEDSDVTAPTDFQLYFSQEEGEFGASLLTHRSGDADGYFMLLVSPSAELKSDRILPKDVVFVLDSSGSMAGAKLEQAKKALVFCIESLGERDRFEVIRFSTEAEAVFDKLIDVTQATRSRAAAFIKDVKSTGGTAIDEALQRALRTRPGNGRGESDQSERPYVVVFLTDGRPTVGVTDEQQILRNVEKRNDANTRIFVFGIGTDVNTHLLDKLADQTRAASQYVLPEEDIEVKVSNFFTRIREPVLANPKLTFPDAVRVTKAYPSPLPDIFKGDQLIVVGRYSGNGAGKLRLAGTVNAREVQFDYDVSFPKGMEKHEFIPRLWATRRVGYLLDEIRLRGDSKELRDEVTELARQYGIVTPYTTYLIVEDERQRTVASERRTLQLNEPEQARELSRFYYSFGREKSGAAGVAGAQTTDLLKRADAPSAAVAGAESAARRGMLSTPRVEARIALQPSQPPGTPTPATRTQHRDSSSAVRFAGGRAFYFNDGAWIDSRLQDDATAKPVRVVVGSPEFFRLTRNHPSVLELVALGPSVHFVLDGKAYHVTDESK